MKVLLLNTSPHQQGCTYTALREVEKTLQEGGVETQLIWAGNNVQGGCMSCMVCRKTKKCAKNDIVNDLIPLFEEADGLVIGSPVHFASATGTAACVVDRLFYASRVDKRMKVGACVVSCRRGGASATFDELNKYFTISGMPVASSQYWNSVHGYTPEDVMKDKEGMQTMRTLGRNMAFLIKSIKLGKEAYGLPEVEEWERTNFIQ
ncbi:MAG: flavodoxin family protein [Clostridiales bacterium]|jgi:multimeric flavodoxin WrbA|nr:flavodoxin family protein [Clostridiales bacterium]MDR2752381.1 flavodoxin family protein [Clostridiales bacterium]